MIRRTRPVAAGRSHELLCDAVRPLVADMQHVRGLTWAGPLGEGVRAVVSLRSLKGDQLDLVYGICCEWVPVTWARPSTFEWPRTPLHTTLHLWVDHWTVGATDRQWISSRFGEGRLERDARRAVGRAMRQAPVWWAGVSDAPGVLAEARRQAVPSDVHTPSARLVAAFTLARLGELETAEAELAGDGVPEHARLRNLLRIAAARG